MSIVDHVIEIFFPHTMNQLNDPETLDIVYDTYLKSVLKIEQGKND